MVNCVAIMPLTVKQRKIYFVLKDPTSLALETKKKPSVASQDAVYIVSHLPMCLAADAITTVGRNLMRNIEGLLPVIKRRL